ncbi:hypothetical protein M0R04_15260 [Candidatus Dojkabacteria bacterium]|jgi:hypothetical protein|nr:hypothetical protein [Candidatus Dojkabacteria bacterium]
MDEKTMTQYNDILVKNYMAMYHHDMEHGIFEKKKFLRGDLSLWNKVSISEIVSLIEAKTKNLNNNTLSIDDTVDIALYAFILYERLVIKSECGRLGL